VWNPAQEDLDQDGEGDACDCDIDSDGVNNSNPGCPDPKPEDNCPFAVNPDQQDCDGDGIGDACESCLDCDGDGDCFATDCDPLNPDVFHGATEKCNGVDDNCVHGIDEEDAEGCSSFFWDQDQDGWGTSQEKCLCQPSGLYTAVKSGDCDDGTDEVIGCDDGDPCTLDSCLPNQGCSNEPIPDCPEAQ